MSTNLSNTTPSPPGGKTNVIWQADGNGNISGYVPTPITSVTWDSLGNAVAPLVLANAGFSTTFNHTSAVSWTWANVALSTVGTPQSSPVLNIKGTYWTGAVSAVDSWTVQNVIGAGANGTSTLTFAHTGSTGFASVSLPTIKPLGSSTPVIGDSTNGIAVFGAAVGILSGGTAYMMLGNGGGITVAGTLSIGFSSGGNAYAGADSGVSRLLPGVIAVGNGAAGDFSGKLKATKLSVVGLQVFANNAAAIAGSLVAGDFYRTGADPDVVCVVH